MGQGLEAVRLQRPVLYERAGGGQQDGLDQEPPLLGCGQHPPGDHQLVHRHRGLHRLHHVR